MAFGRYAKAEKKGSGGIAVMKEKKEVFLVSVTLPNGKVKEFRNDEYNEDTILSRLKKIHGNSLVVTRKSLDFEEVMPICCR